jgi:hypothetical protein
VQVIEFFQWVETLISLANFQTSMYFHEVVHFAVHGPEICPGNLGGNIKFPPPEIPSLNPENSGGQKFHPKGRNFRPCG